MGDFDDLEDEEATNITPMPVRRPTLNAVRTPPKFMLALHEGSPVGEYEIQAQIGEGAMGTVYSAIQPLIGKTVAIKVLKPELCANQGSIDRFVQEAQAVNRIGHPNIVDVFSLGELPDGRAYFVMEWLRGEDLKMRLSRGPIPVSDTCDILDGIARALDAAHGKEIVHRDLKPDNVFLQQIDTGPIMVKLLDFGIAKLMRDKLLTEKTQTGNMLGTPRYISPEQARGVDVTHRSDIYSLGVMAYEMLAGRPPFSGETGMDIVVKHLNEPPPPLAQFARVPKSLEQCVMRMLAKDPAERPTLASVRKVLVDPTQRLTDLELGRRPRHQRYAIFAGGLVLAGALGFGAWHLLGGDDATPPAVVAEVPKPVVTPSPPPPPPPAPPPAVPRGAALDITVGGRSDATIFVDGTQWGRGVAIRVGVSAGAHAVEVRAPGGEPITRTVDVADGQTLAVALDVPPPVRMVQRQRPVARVKPKTKPVVTPPPAATDDGLLKPKGHR